ncbi:hypothetical protein SteCoe_16932 [Stentor coeruleus]|uniref:Uncharacterized protein n=1 Tax=Stentor coeruleus TaxID=5963 RepID=A0A1R2C035_9CILI|nr:hypothetical protein SteCoe_16932 [Stentor coeruleus]
MAICCVDDWLCEMKNELEIDIEEKSAHYSFSFKKNIPKLFPLGKFRWLDRPRDSIQKSFKRSKTWNSISNSHIYMKDISSCPLIRQSMC